MIFTQISVVSLRDYPPPHHRCYSCTKSFVLVFHYETRLFLSSESYLLSYCFFIENQIYLTTFFDNNVDFLLLFTDSIQSVLDANNIFTIAKRTVEGQVTILLYLLPFKL